MDPLDPITIAHLPVVSGGVLHGGRVVLSNVEVVDGKSFFHVSKSDRDIERLLLGRIAANERVLQHVMLFDAMLVKRQEAVNALLEPPADAADDLGLDQPAKKKIKKTKTCCVFMC
jgi:hypothetical protein